MACPFCTGGICDTKGNHHVACAGKRAASIRHDAIVHIIHDNAVLGGVSCEMEVNGFLPAHEDGSQKRVDNFFHGLAGDGKSLGLDLTVINGAFKSNALPLEYKVDEMFNERANFKKQKYGKLLSDKQISFKPFVVNSLHEG